MTELSPARRWLVFAALVPGILMAMLDATVISIAVPSIVWGFNTTITEVTWVMNAYNLGLTVLFLPMGRVADRFGHKRVYITGLVVFTVFSFLCARAVSIEWLDAFRVGQAIGAAALIPISLAILMSVFPKEKRGFAAGLYGAVTSLAAALGPSIGGVLVSGKFSDWVAPWLERHGEGHQRLLDLANWLWEVDTWRLVFYVNVPVGVAAVIGALFLVPRSRDLARDARVDLPGICLAAGGLFCLTLSIIEWNDWGWLSGRVLALDGAALVTLGAFVWWELRSDSPMLDLRLFRNRAFAAANAAVMTIDVAMMGTMFLLVIYMVGVLDFLETKAAWAVTPMPLAMVILTPIAGRLVDRIGPRILVVAGSLTSAAGLYLLGTLQIDASLGDIAWRTAIVGVGIGLSLPALMAAGMTALPRERQGIGSGSLNTSRQLGFVLGVAILTAVFSHAIAVRLPDANASSRRIVESSALLSDEYKASVLRSLDEAAKIDVAHGIEAIRKLSNPAADIAPPPSGTPAALGLQMVEAQIKVVYRGTLEDGFTWPFRAAAIFALLSLPPGLLLGRRLGAGGSASESAAGEEGAGAGPDALAEEPPPPR